MLGVAFAWLVGRAVAVEQHLAAELHATRAQLAERALLDQRRRIARDVHDLVGHGLAAMLLQVTSARHVLRRDPDAAEAGLRDAEEIGRRAMQDLRGTVGLLRGHDDEVAPAPPSAREIPTLVDHARGGGLAVELRVSGDLTRVGASIDAALYRIAQETLANAARHAPTARTLLAVEVEDDTVRLNAETSGPIARTTEPGRPRYGLVGMRERAVTLGGELRAGPTPDGWRLDCRLPLEAA
jgi:signal transduction histidine kinase